MTLSMAVNKRQSVLNILSSSGHPGRDMLPDIGWLAVAELKIDGAYQHRPYSEHISLLEKEYQPDYSGLILVNIRESGDIYVIDGATRKAVHEKRGYRWIRAEILKGLNQSEEAYIYLLRAKNVQRQPVDWFLAEVT